MLTFLDELRSMPVPGEAGWTPDTLANGILRAEDELLTARLQDPEEHIEPEVIESLLSYTNWLELVAASKVAEDLDVAKAAYVAGGVRELLHELTGNWSDRDEVLGLSLLLLSSRHPYFGKRLPDKVRIRNPRTNLQRLFSALLEFARGNHTAVVRGSASALDRMRGIDPMSVTETDLPRLAIYRTLVEASLSVSQSLLFGNSLSGVRAVDSLEAWLSEKSVHYPTKLVQLVQRWLAATRAVIERSVTQVLRNVSVDQQYKDLLLSSGIAEFWPQQADAIKSGLLADESSVISLPTGSGKTLLAELAFATRLRFGVDGWGCYIAPSRALVYQAARDLAERLSGIGITVRTVMAGAEDGAALEDELDSLATPRTITVATQERLDAYYRSDPDRFTSMNILVVDEAQQVGDAERGILLEQLVTKVKYHQPECKIVLLSATSSNVQELGEWLQGSSYAAHSRVNRQQLAVAVQVRDQSVVIRERELRSEPRRRIAVKGGLVTAGALSLAKPGEGVTVCAYGSFEAQIQQRLVRNQWLDIDGGTNSVDHASQLAEKFHARGESTLVFCSTPASTRVQAIGLASKSTEIAKEPGELEELVRTIASLIGEEHALVECATKGIAYHHASLPPTILRIIEYGFRAGLLRTLYATSTLREGVNLPASNVIVAGEMRPQGQRNAPMRVSDFVNLAGRAGRPQYDREGLAILVPNRLANAFSVANRYLLYGPDELAVRSAMDSLIEFLSGYSDANRFDRLEPPLQSILLSLYSSGIDSQPHIEGFLESTLARTQIDFDINEVTTNLANEFRRIESISGGERLRAMAKTGLSLLGNEAMFNFAETNLSLLASGDQAVSYSEVNPAIARQAALACQEVPDIRRGKLEGSGLWEENVFSTIIDQWISGAPYVALARLSPFNSSPHPIEDAVDTLADLSQWLPWPLGALQVAVRAHGYEPDPFVSFLPLYIRFGVPTRTASHLSLAGIFDREVAIEYSQDPKLQGASFRDVADWALQELPELKGAHELVRRLMQHRRTRSQFITAEVTSDELGLDEGEFLTLARVDDSLVIESHSRAPLAVGLTGAQNTIPPNRKLRAMVTRAQPPTYTIRAFL